MYDSDTENTPLLDGIPDLRDQSRGQSTSEPTSPRENSATHSFTSERSSSRLEEYRPESTRKVAIKLIYLCHLSTWTAAYSGIYLLPRMVYLPDKYQYVIHLIKILFYCSGWIAGVLTDCLVPKKLALLVSVITSSGGYMACMLIVHYGKDNQEPAYMNQTSGNNMTYMNLTPSDADIKHHLVDNLKPGFAYAYFVILIAASVMTTFLNVILPTLGGDQIPPTADRRDVRTFYTLFYFFSKVGETLTELCFLLDSHFRYQLTPWVVLMLLSCSLSILTILILSFWPKLIREPNPDMSVLTDGFGILRQAFNDRKKRPSGVCFLYGASLRFGGKYPPAAIHDRIRIAKFAVLCVVLIPVALAVAPSGFVDYNPQKLGCGNETSKNEKYHNYDVLISVHLAQTITAGVGILLLYCFCHVTSNIERFGRPTMFWRLVAGHLVMVIAAVTALIGYYKSLCTDYYKILPYSLTGITNALIYTTGYELTFLSAPRSMQGTAMGMYFLVSGIGYSLNMVLAEYLPTTVDGAILWVWSTGIGGNLLGLVLLVIAHQMFDLRLNEK